MITVLVNYHMIVGGDDDDGDDRDFGKSFQNLNVNQVFNLYSYNS